MPFPRLQYDSTQFVYQPIGLNFWFQWVLVTTIAVTALYWTRVWFLGGAIVGLAQGLLLRRYLSKSIAWIGLTCVGWLISSFPILILLLTMGMIGSWSEPIKWIELALMFGAISGVVIGFFQQSVIHCVAPSTKQWMCATTVWTVVTVVSGALGVAVTLAKALEPLQIGGLALLSSVSWVVLGVMLGGIYGLMTGGVMVWLLRQSMARA
jgi:hypothetical protein